MEVSSEDHRIDSDKSRIISQLIGNVKCHSSYIENFSPPKACSPCSGIESLTNGVKEIKKLPIHRDNLVESNFF